MAITVSLVNSKRKIVVLTQPTTVKKKRIPPQPRDSYILTSLAIVRILKYCSILSEITNKIHQFSGIILALIYRSKHKFQEAFSSPFESFRHT